MDGRKSTSRGLAGTLLSAQNQQALKQILQDSQSKDADTRLLALQRFNGIFRKFIGPDPEESTMQVASNLLEKGFLKPIAEGLKDCIAEPWRIVMEGFAIFSQSEVCIKALECLALDSRNVKYILQEYPSLPADIRTLFLNGLTLAQRSATPPDVRVTRAILQALPKFFMVESARAETGRSADFLNAVMRHALRHFGDLVTLRGSVMMLLSLRKFLSDPALEDNIFCLAGKILSESSDPMLINFTVTMLHGVERTRLSTEGYVSKPLAPNPALRCAALALVLCPEQLDEDEDYHALMVLLGRALEYGTPAARAANRCPPPGLTDNEDAERLANADPAAWARARVLRTLLSEELDADGDEDFRVRFVRPKLSDGARGVEGARKAETMGLKAADRKKATRCSGPGCDKAETRPGEFQMCGGCRLAVYCGKDCQRRAWKAGHKGACQKTG